MLFYYFPNCYQLFDNLKTSRFYLFTLSELLFPIDIPDVPDQVEGGFRCVGGALHKCPLGLLVVSHSIVRARISLMHFSEHTRSKTICRRLSRARSNETNRHDNEITVLQAGDLTLVAHAHLRRSQIDQSQIDELVCYSMLRARQPSHRL